MPCQAAGEVLLWGDVGEYPPPAEELVLRVRLRGGEARGGELLRSGDVSRNRGGEKRLCEAAADVGEVSRDDDVARGVATRGERGEPGGEAERRNGRVSTLSRHGHVGGGSTEPPTHTLSR